ncbi:hypothetical protein, partial [Pseudovibrio sp. SPO723]|uniref:hypothetical protein n=1 Tax=Nesiotobacter zosterae TaxID=392721 RepID=UPI0029C19EC0
MFFALDAGSAFRCARLVRHDGGGSVCVRCVLVLILCFHIGFWVILRWVLLDWLGLSSVGLIC